MFLFFGLYLSLYFEYGSPQEFSLSFPPCTFCGIYNFLFFRYDDDDEREREREGEREGGGGGLATFLLNMPPTSTKLYFNGKTYLYLCLHVYCTNKLINIYIYIYIYIWNWVWFFVGFCYCCYGIIIGLGGWWCAEKIGKIWGGLWLFVFILLGHEQERGLYCTLDPFAWQLLWMIFFL